jgi:carbon-monoxide dehydrogenase medium subunit
LILPDFRYHRVDHFSEALDLLQQHGSDAKILAGGTDLLLHLKRGNVWGRPCPGQLISLRNIADLNSLRREDGHIKIGAGATHRQAELSPLVRAKLTALHDAVSRLASVQIRNIATLAGNVCNAAPCADTAAPLMALGAVAKITSLKTERTVALKDFFQGTGRVDLTPEEILKELWLPEPPDFSDSAYLKAARREAMDITIIGAAVYLCTTPDLKKIQDVRIALNTVAPKPVRAEATEKMLIGSDISDTLFEEAGKTAAEHATPRTSFRSTAEYRREMVKVFVRRALSEALERIRTRVRGFEDSKV